MATSPQRVIRSTLCLVLGFGFSGSADQVALFPMDQIQDCGSGYEIGARLNSDGRIANPYGQKRQEVNKRAALN